MSKPKQQKLVPFFDLETEKWFAIHPSKFKDGAPFDLSEATEIDERRAQQLGA